ncbi:MAG TPA: PHP domain-containing protein [Clostridia bacterium]|nr:PHP domain-containing protein [Clostridia bacterium]
MYADLHIHTTASDGVLSPEEVVKQAASIGLKAIAITDHDTTDGIFPAVKAGNIHNLEVIPGVEINTEYDNEEIHLLGYYLDYELPFFQELLVKLRNDREERAKKMVDILEKLGKPISLLRLKEISQNSAVGRPHIARCLVEAGYVSSNKEAFDTLIGKGRPAYVPRFKLTPTDAVKFIRKANGIPVLAHPGENFDLQYLKELIKNGLLGLEVFHSDHSNQTKIKLKKIALQYNLIITGGSDFHGGERAASSQIGTNKVPYSSVQKMKIIKARLG